jgi:hypothetical protein
MNEMPVAKVVFPGETPNTTDNCHQASIRPGRAPVHGSPTRADPTGPTVALARPRRAFCHPKHPSPYGSSARPHDVAPRPRVTWAGRSHAQRRRSARAACGSGIPQHRPAGVYRALSACAPCRQPAAARCALNASLRCSPPRSERRTLTAVQCPCAMTRRRLKSDRYQFAILWYFSHQRCLYVGLQLYSTIDDVGLRFTVPVVNNFIPYHTGSILLYGGRMPLRYGTQPYLGLSPTTPSHAPLLLTPAARA